MKYMTPKTKATAKRKCQLVHPANKILVDFQDELQKLAEDASRKAVETIYRTIQTCQDALTPEKLSNPGPLGTGTALIRLSHTLKYS